MENLMKTAAFETFSPHLSAVKKRPPGGGLEGLQGMQSEDTRCFI